MEEATPATRAATHAAALFAACGILAFALILVPGPGRSIHLAWVAAMVLVVAAAARALPWRRWSTRWTLVLAVPAFASIGVASLAEVLPPRSYGIFFVLVFAWVGAHHPPLTSVGVVPVAAPFYVIPLLAGDVDPPFDPRGFVLVMATGILVAETIARAGRDREHARLRAEQAAAAFRVVGATNARVRRLEPREVLDVVVDSAMELGYDAANLAVLQPEEETFRAVHPRGLAVAYASGVYPLRAGLTGQVVEAGDVVVVGDYQRTERSIAEIRRSGLRTCIGVPVFSEDNLAAVLLVGFAARRTVHPEMREALRLLAGAAGAALANARELASERELAANSLAAANTDELTGVGNRRAANAWLQRLQTGDCVVMLDLDRFKAVNDRYGHAAGDELLAGLASHLHAELRTGDRIFRYGGEEFLVLLPSTSTREADVIVERLLASWRATSPTTTFSASIAQHHQDERPESSVARADAALFEAKRAGRDRSRMATEDAPIVL